MNERIIEENIDLTKVVPVPTLGKNFEENLSLELNLSTKAMQYGDKNKQAIEPINADFTSSAFKNFEEMKSSILRTHQQKCAFCGFTSKHNEIHNLNDVHGNIESENLTIADPICHAWNHLGEQSENASFLAFLPDLLPTDVNHLQRTIMIALDSDDLDLQKDAKEIMNWLASHRLYVNNVWQSFEPTVFAEVFKRFDEDLQQRKSHVFNDIALVVNPYGYKKYVKAWKAENYRQYPISNWSNIYHKYMHSA